MFLHVLLHLILVTFTYISTPILEEAVRVTVTSLLLLAFFCLSALTKN